MAAQPRLNLIDMRLARTQRGAARELQRLAAAKTTISVEAQRAKNEIRHGSKKEVSK